MSRRTFLLLIIASLSTVLVACNQGTPADGVVEIAARPVESITPVVIFVTPTTAPTQIPTYEIITPSATAVPATETPIPSLTPDSARIEAECVANLATMYEQAGLQCLGKPRGFFCNGGSAPSAEPAGAIEGALAVPGALVEAGVVDMVETAALSATEGGLMWLRLENLQLDAFLAGQVRVRDMTPPDSNLPAWQAIQVETFPTTSDCGAIPENSFIVQNEYGQPTSFALNGASVDMDGTLVAQTSATETVLIVVEGRARLTIFGTPYSMVAGQQVNLPHADGNFSVVNGQPAGGVQSLDATRIVNLPVTLLDLPLQLPQPGYAETQGNVNLRAEPSLDGLLLYRVPAEEILMVLGMNPERDWLHVRLINGETGWMSRELLLETGVNISAMYDATPVPPQRPGDLGELATVISEQGGNLRTGPDVGFGIITTLTQGSAVRLLARSPYSSWVQVDAGGQVGWMALLTLETRAAISFLSVDYDVPQPPRQVALPTATPNLNRGGGHAYPDPLSGQ
ncbi:MAG: SH3 domain-containing protein [Aggregatilineales bacterium]